MQLNPLLLPFPVASRCHSSCLPSHQPQHTVAAADAEAVAPFPFNTYEMLDDSSTDHIVSWSPSGHSFVVWNPPEFSRLLLPTYFKHKNFPSFIRQLNTYGFGKIDPEKWEFANDDFVKGQKHLLKNIRCKKVVHSHSHRHGSASDPERTAFKEEIERLSCEKAALEVNIRFKHQGSVTKIQIDDLTCHYRGMEEFQEKLLSFLEKAVQDLIFAEHLAHKKENISLDSDRGSPPDVGTCFGKRFSNNLRLKLSPAISDINLGTSSMQSFEDDGFSLGRRMCEGNPRDARTSIKCTLFLPEAVDHSELKMDTILRNVIANGSSIVNSLQEVNFCEEVDGNVCCLLALASSAFSNSSFKAGVSDREQGQETGRTPWQNTRESHDMSFPNNKDMADDDIHKRASKELATKNEEQAALAPPVRVNDAFWEPCLAEKPGPSENEEPWSCNRANIDNKF